MMRLLAGEDTRISFEGQLARTELFKMAGAMFEETVLLKRNTVRPKLDFVILPLTSHTVPVIEKAIVSKIPFKNGAGIVHVQIEQGGKIAFAAYDGFDEGCVWVGSAVPESLLEELVDKRVLHSYKRTYGDSKELVSEN